MMNNASCDPAPAPVVLGDQPSPVDEAIRTLAEYAVVVMPLTIDNARATLRQARLVTHPALRDGQEHDATAVKQAAETLSLFFGVVL
jgi:hypothetical protein